MKTYHHNSEQWYANAMPLWMRLLRWLVWLGGWEDIIHDRQGYRVRLRPCRWRPGTRGWRMIYEGMIPIALFGHRIVFQWFGFHISTRRGYLCVCWPSHTSPHHGPGLNIFWSPNATPWAATVWLLGAPSEVITAATMTGRLAEERERQRVA